MSSWAIDRIDISESYNHKFLYLPEVDRIIDVHKTTTKEKRLTFTLSFHLPENPQLKNQKSDLKNSTYMRFGIFLNDLKKLNEKFEFMEFFSNFLKICCQKFIEINSTRIKTLVVNERPEIVATRLFNKYLYRFNDIINKIKSNQEFENGILKSPFSRDCPKRLMRSATIPIPVLTFRNLMVPSVSIPETNSNQEIFENPSEQVQSQEIFETSSEQVQSQETEQTRHQETEQTRHQETEQVQCRLTETIEFNQLENSSETNGFGNVTFEDHSGPFTSFQSENDSAEDLSDFDNWNQFELDF